MSTGNFYIQDRSLLRRYLAIIGILGLVLLGLLLSYNLLTKPPEVQGDNNKPNGLTSVFSIYGFEEDRLNNPISTAIDVNGNIYIADSAKHRIVVFDSNGNYLDQFGEAGQNKYQLWYPNSVAVAENGKVYVACKQSNRVVIFDSSHKPTWQIDIPQPLALAIKNKRLYVTTPRGIMIGDLNGNLINTFGTRGPNPGQVDFPTGIAVDNKGNIYVADSMNYRVQAFSPEGKSLWTYGKPPKKGDALMDMNRTFGLPGSISIDSDGILYLVDSFDGEIYEMNSNGKVLDKVGSWGHAEGQFYYPAGIAYAGNETFAVADEFNNRVQVIRIPSPLISPVARVSRFGIPIAVLIALATLLLWTLRRRTFRYVLDETFLEKALNKGCAISLIHRLGNVYVTKAVFERYKDKEENGIKLSELLKTRAYSLNLANAIAAEQKMNDEVASVLSLAKELKGRRIVVLTESNKLIKAAKDLDIMTKGYDDLVESVGNQAAKEPA